MIEIGDLLPLADFFVLITCANRRHVQALCEEIHQALKKKKLEISGKEGKGYDRWVLLDAGSVIVHFFEEQAREYYDLDGLWADAEAMEWQSGQ